jgi:hypothetical protein
MMGPSGHRRVQIARLGALAFALLAAAWPPSPVRAQLATATLRGTVTQAGAPAGGCEILARDINSGIQVPATADASGRYVLSGLRPSSYEISYRTPAGQTVQQQVTISVGQTATFDVEIPPPSDAEVATPTPPSTPPSAGPDIVVMGGPLVETRTFEIATNIGRRLIEGLPQPSRNFLSFADLAPGVRSSNSEYRKTFSAGGVGQDPNGDSLGGPQVNVFIDGASLKGDIQQGGVVGQDSSRGNPFPQAAIQEYRVLTSSFKAEYEDAATAVITAITKSGGNEFHGDVFGFYQNAALRAKTYFQEKDDLEEPDYYRVQYGASLGGPIIKDKLHFFGAYEGNDENRTVDVIVGQPTDPSFAFDEYEGSFDSPFREDLGFGKLSWQVDGRNRLELAGSLRSEHEVAGFGGQTAEEAGSRIRNRVYTGNLRWQYDMGDFLNEASVDYLFYGFEPAPVNPNLVGQNYQGVVRFGGASTTQDVRQKGFTLRDAVTFSNVDFLAGSHVIKLGGKASFQDYHVSNALNANPVFNYREDAEQGLDFSFPYEAQFGVGDPSVAANNVAIGLFVQDDWELNQHLTLNLGLRWDYQTNAINNDFETSPEAEAALRFLETELEGMPGNTFRADDYISTGDNRKPYWKAFQPRVGLSYDLNGDQRTVFFGGFGRYFDRVLFRNAAEESLLETYESRTFYFSPDGMPRNNQPTIMWDPALMSAAALSGLIDSGVAPGQELRVLRNDTRPPHVDQFSIGIRQEIFFLNTSLTYTHVEGRDLVGYVPLNRATERNAAGMLDTIVVPGYGTVVGLNQDRATRYDAVFAAIDKPYSAQSPWSVGLAYTLTFSEERGYAFNFDFPNVADQPYRPNAGDERHRVVVSGLVDLPLGFQASTLFIWGSGQPYFVTDASEGYDEDLVLANTGETKDFHQLDLRLTKNFKLYRTIELQLMAELFNVFNRANFGTYDGLKSPEGNMNFGKPNGLSGPPRSLQFGARCRF